MLRPNLNLNYNQLESNIKTLHPVRAKKFLQILDIVRDCIDKGIRPTYRMIHQATRISSRTIAAFWKWMKEQGVGLRDIFLTRAEEVSGTIQHMMDRGVKPKYRDLRRKLKCSFSTISKAFKTVVKAVVPVKTSLARTENRNKPASYNEARERFDALSQAEKEKYYKQARAETGSDDEAVIESFAIGIFAKTATSPTPTTTDTKKAIVVQPDNQVQVTAKKVLEVFNECLQARRLNPLKELSRKDRRSLSRLLKSGYQLEDIVRVIKFKADEWLNETRMVPSFRPQTLFKPGNFSRYLNQVILQANTKNSQYRPLRKGTTVQYRGRTYTVSEEGWLFTDDESIVPYRVWSLAQDGKIQIIKEVQ